MIAILYPTPVLVMIAFLLSSHGHANTPQGLVMNGVRYADYEGFEEVWPQVTVRFRTDIGELRYTYANPSAYVALVSSSDYPNGAVFAKIGAKTQDDPDFLSSKTPSGAVRYQFMVRDTTRCADTGGWCYALFAIDKTPVDQERDTVKACHACHEKVAHKRYVFSDLARISSRLGPHAGAAAGNAVPKPAAAPALDRLRFTRLLRAAIPPQIEKELPAAADHLWRLDDQGMQTHYFDGTFGELRPTLLAKALASHAPALFVANDPSRFVLVTPVAKPDRLSPQSIPVCGAGHRLYRASFTFFTPSGRDATVRPPDPAAVKPHLIHSFSCEAIK